MLNVMRFNYDNLAYPPKSCIRRWGGIIVEFKGTLGSFFYDMKWNIEIHIAP